MCSSECWISSNHCYAWLISYAAVDVPHDAGSLCCCQDTFDSALACCHPRTPGTFSAELLPMLQCYYKNLIWGAFALAGFLEASICPISSRLSGSFWMGPCSPAALAVFRKPWADDGATCFGCAKYFTASKGICITWQVSILGLDCVGHLRFPSDLQALTDR